MPAFTDQLHRTITLDHPPHRIISLVPSQTELLYALGLEQQIVGITKFCVHPDHWRRSKTRIGGTKDFHIDKIRELQPDLIIANKEENMQDQVEQLCAHYPVWVSDIATLDDALDMIRSVGSLTGKSNEAVMLAGEIRHRFDILKPAPPLRTAYFIWRNPWTVSGGRTFIHHMLERCGLINIFADRNRYPVIQPEELTKLDCQLVLLSSEPYPFREKHIDEIRSFLPNAIIKLVDGEMFSWYGSRLLESPYYLQGLLEEP